MESLHVNINDIYLYILNNFHVNKFTFEREIFARSGYRDCWFRDFDQPSPQPLSVVALVPSRMNNFPSLQGYSMSILATREGRNRTHEIFEPVPVLSTTQDLVKGSLDQSRAYRQMT